jgi:DeoR/GlpR family transcriptional regulator of sugar metabolism
LDAGTTVYGIARALPAAFAGTLITHSAPVMQIALQFPQATTLALGGQLLHDSQAFIGEIAISTLDRLRAETAFIGIAGVDENGLYIDRDLELSTKRAIIAASSKMERNSLVRLGDFRDIDLLVTNEPPPPRIATALARANVDVIVGSGGAGSTE